ncbi:MAG: VTT domain-containing protein [Bryobacterales bacterium]|nr:VTT domain-containing protein [Bryobacterales bacterium]
MISPPTLVRPRLLPWIAVSAVILFLILATFVLFEDRLNAFSDSILNGRSSRPLVAAGVIGLLGSDIVLPIPSSLVSTAAGGLLGFWAGAAASFAGMTIACLSGYWLGRYGGARIIGRFVKDAEMVAARARFGRAGDWTLIAARPIPVLAEASVVFAGMLGRPFSRVLSLCCLSNLAIAAVYSAVGSFALKADSFLLAFAGSILIPWVAMRLGRGRDGGAQEG